MKNVFQCAWLLVLCASIPVFAQQSAPPAQPLSSSHQITIDVVAAGKHGDHASGLQKQDFTIIDNKHPQTITSFVAHNVNAPTSDPDNRAIIVIDTVNTDFQMLASQRQQLQKFFTQNGGHLPIPINLVIFSNTGLQVQPEASNDGKVELDFLNKYPVALHQDNRAQGSAGAFDRISRSLAVLQSLAMGDLKLSGSKLLIWISPGWPIPQESALGLSGKEKAEVYNQIVAITGLLLMSRTRLYDVDPSGTMDAGSYRIGRYQYYLNEIKSPTQPQIGNLALQVFAIHSGGQVFMGSNDLSGGLNKCLSDATNFYTISFDPGRADHPNEYHHVEIKVDKPGIKARTRDSYYLQP